MKLSLSQQYFSKSRDVLVGGVNSPVRAFKAVGGDPLVIHRGKGAWFEDVDGKRYTDYCLSWGSLILGHANAKVISSVKTSISLGTSFGATTKPEIDIAKFITNNIPSIDLIRFVNSGTEATMSAIRVARGFTQKSKIIKFDGCYHGHSDDLLAMAGSGVAFLSASSSQGVPQAHIQDTISLPYNDSDILVQTIERHHAEIACVILEPVVGNMGVILPRKDFLKTLRAITKKHGIVLIFDEVMTGFRSNIAGAQGDFDITPDLTCLGKIIGAGFPIGAYGGRRDIMECLSPIGGVYQAGTFSGNPIVMRAGLEVLHQLTPAAYKKINALAGNFAHDINAFFKSNKLKAYLSHYQGMMSLRFSYTDVSNDKEAKLASSDNLYAKLFHYLLAQGIYWPPADLEAFFISTVHTEKDLTKLAKSLKTFFQANTGTL